MFRLDQFSGKLVREGKFPPQSRHIVVQAVNIRNPTAHDNDLRVQNTDHHGQGLGQAPLIARHAGLGLLVTVRRQFGNFMGFQVHARGGHEIAAQARPGQKGFDAPRVAAIAGWAGPFIIVRPGQGRMAPFAGNKIGTLVQAATNNDAAPRARADNDAKDAARPPRGAIASL